ncbi:uncharacterized protein [Macrobrachium rosenbergii]|uniref:uncharacterized protein n=1 Tax=Macrobrachium rosenbergii TaxID=79674 RepID=UPI0034D78824
MGLQTTLQEKSFWDGLLEKVNTGVEPDKKPPLPGSKGQICFNLSLQEVMGPTGYQDIPPLNVFVRRYLFLLPLGKVVKGSYCRGFSPVINGAAQPVAFFSKKFNPAETRYSTFDRELCAITMAKPLKSVWHRVQKDATSWAKQCLQCQTSKVGRHTQYGVCEFPQSERRFGHIHVDVIRPLSPSGGSRYLQTVVDRLTRWPEATASACAEALLSTPSWSRANLWQKIATSHHCRDSATWPASSPLASARTPRGRPPSHRQNCHPPPTSSSGSTPSAMKNWIRLTKEQFAHLLNLMTPHIEKADTKMRKAVSAAQRLTLTLRYLATGESQVSLGYQFRISHNLVSSLIPETCRAIYNIMKTEYLKLPSTPEEWNEIALHYFQQWNFPNCIGALDGKRVLNAKPPHSGAGFHDYKGHFSMIMMALVDASYKFLYVNIGVA